MHGEDAGIEDINLVDFPGGDYSHSPGDGITLDYLTEGIASLLGELLGVVEVGIAIVGRKDDGGGIYTAGKATSARLIAAGFDQGGVIIG